MSEILRSLDKKRKTLPPMSKETKAAYRAMSLALKTAHSKPDKEAVLSHCRWFLDAREALANELPWLWSESF